MLDELRDFDRSTPKKHAMMEDEAYAAGYLRGLMDSHHLRVAVDPVAGPVGLLGALKVDHFFNPKKRMAVETFWWVNRQHRGGRAGAYLLTEYRRWARENADLITLSLEANSPVNEKTLEKRGFKAHERSFLMEV